MWIADKWKDYEVLDTSSGDKLERWGKYILRRPDPQVIWRTPMAHPMWKHLNGHYHRSSKGGGSWEFFDLPEQWQISYRDLTFCLKPFSFKHTGLFPEQAVNWDWCADLIRAESAARAVRTREDGPRKYTGAALPENAGTGRSGGKDTAHPVKVLNLFAYTGGATVSAAAAGAHVTHVDASKGMVGWAKENAAVSGLADAPIRYLVDDCMKFVEREIRRGNHYDGIIMDPPSYGRGPKGEIWKIEDSIFDFIKRCTLLLSDKPLFFLVNSYTTGLQPAVLKYMLQLALADRGGSVEADEVGLPVTASGLVLPCGAAGRWQAK